MQGFYVILTGKISLLWHAETKLVLTRLFSAGEQIGFAGMIALRDREGTAVAKEESFVLEISADQFFELHLSAPQISAY